jgi:hypothetical protein
MPSTFEYVSGNPLLGVTRDAGKGLKVIETERSPIAPRSGLILERAGEVVEKNGPFSLLFCQIVALMLPHRNVFAGLLLVVLCPA